MREIIFSSLNAGIITDNMFLISPFHQIDGREPALTFKIINV